MLSSLPYWGLQSEINRLSIVVSVIVIKWFVSLSHHFSHLILVCVVGPVAAVAAFLKKIGIQKKIAEPMVPLLVQPEEPTKLANQTGYVVGAAYAGQLHVCVHGGFQFQVEDLPNMLAAIIQLHYILHIQFPDNAPSMHGFLCHVMGERKEDIKLSKTQKELLSKVCWTVL